MDFGADLMEENEFPLSVSWCLGEFLLKTLL